MDHKWCHQQNTKNDQGPRERFQYSRESRARLREQPKQATDNQQCADNIKQDHPQRESPFFRHEHPLRNYLVSYPSDPTSSATDDNSWRDR